MNVVLHHEAEVEFWSSIEFYESKEPGLGIRFKQEVDTCIDRIVRNPELPSIRKTAYRRVNLPVFKHYVAYIIRGKTIWVVAISHAHRRPEFWRGRL